MKILAGQYKGLSIKTVSNAPYRPTKSRVRKSLFDKLSPFHYKSVLDLFSGSGIFGFEAASRGAQQVTFVEKHRKTFHLIRANSSQFNNTKFNYVCRDVFKYLTEYDESYDIIFADPPYGMVDLEILKNSVLPILNENGKFLLECERNQPEFDEATVTDYGDTRIQIWTK